jgi:hypothetical protein
MCRFPREIPPPEGTPEIGNPRRTEPGENLHRVDGPGPIIFHLHRWSIPAITGTQPVIWGLPNITGRPTLACFNKPFFAVVSPR